MTSGPSAPVFDLDAARAARAAERTSKGRGPGVLRVAGEDFELPPELSLDVLNCLGALAAGDPAALTLALRALLNGGLDVVGDPILEAPEDDPDGDPVEVGRKPTPFDRARELAGGFSLDDAEWLVDQGTAVYGVEVPKSSGSGASSPTTTPPSSPTSDGSTD